MDAAARLALLRKRYGRTAVFVDTETTSANAEILRMTTAVAFSCETGQFHFVKTWGPDAEEEIGLLGLLLDGACTIVAHNHQFDFGAVLSGYFAPERVAGWCKRVLDNFELIRAHEGSWIGIDHLCQVAGLQTKTSNGAEAILMWNRGEVDRLAEYCAMDVNLMMRHMEADHLEFCLARWKQRKRSHAGAGYVDMDTRDVHARYGAEAFPTGRDKGNDPCQVEKKETDKVASVGMV